MGYENDIVINNIRVQSVFHTAMHDFNANIL